MGRVLLLLSVTVAVTVAVDQVDNFINYRDEVQVEEERQQQQRRRRRQRRRATETLSQWRRYLPSSSSSSPHNDTKGLSLQKLLRPLDLVLEDPPAPATTTTTTANVTQQTEMKKSNDHDARQAMPRVYQRGDGGFLEPYDFVNYQSNEERMSVNELHLPLLPQLHDEHDDDDDVLKHDDALVHSHVMNGRLGITNLDVKRWGVQHVPTHAINGNGNGNGDNLNLKEEEEEEERRLQHDQVSWYKFVGEEQKDEDHNDNDTIVAEIETEEDHHHPRELFQSTTKLVLWWCGTSYEDAASTCTKKCSKTYGCGAASGQVCFGVGDACNWKLELEAQEQKKKKKEEENNNDKKEEGNTMRQRTNPLKMKEQEQQQQPRAKSYRDKDKDKKRKQHQNTKKSTRSEDERKKNNNNINNDYKENVMGYASNDPSSNDNNKSEEDGPTTEKRSSSKIIKKKKEEDAGSTKNKKRNKSTNNDDGSQEQEQEEVLNVMGYVSANVNTKGDDTTTNLGYEIIDGNIHVSVQPVHRRKGGSRSLLRGGDGVTNDHTPRKEVGGEEGEEGMRRTMLNYRRRDQGEEEEETFDFTHHDPPQVVVPPPPKVKSTFPPVDTTIGHRQTFGALVSSSSDNHDAPSNVIEKVCVQFRDGLGVRSACLPLYNVGSSSGGGGNRATEDGTTTSDVKCTKAENHLSVDCLSSSSTTITGGAGSVMSDIWERTFDGFGDFAGTTWRYRIQAFDTHGTRVVSKWQDFMIDALVGSVVTTTDTTTTPTSTTTSATNPIITTTTYISSTTNCGDGNVGNGVCPTAGDCCSEWGYCGITPEHCETTTSSSRSTKPPVMKLVDVVKDENWPYGGVIQTSTGRILFFFDGNPYVCSGTVIKDTAADRTIVLTAGHCAYQYQPSGGRFTEHVLFIPNQVDTRGVVSDELCTNDPLGCWVPAFAVVHYEWTTKGFPHSVPYDYAYYVIPNDVSAHLRGFIHENQQDLSRILEEIVEPIPIDFDWHRTGSTTSQLNLSGEFIHGLGYSFNRDPAFRYCAYNAGSKFGIPTYENLWLGMCAMTGGSSGGPWLKDTDTDGRGTVISINSWGYASVTGMAGPDFSTASGSKAECLYEVAKNTPFEDMVDRRGIVVDNC